MAVGIRAGAVTPTTAAKASAVGSGVTYVLVQAIGYITGAANDVALAVTKAPLGADEKGLIGGISFFGLLALAHYVGINLGVNAQTPPAGIPDQAQTQADLSGTIQDAVNTAVQEAIAGGALTSLTQVIHAGNVDHTLVVSGKQETLPPPPAPVAAVVPAPVPAVEQSSAPATGVAA